MSEGGRAQGSQLLHEKSYFMSSKPRALNKNRDLRIGHKGKCTCYFYNPRRHRIVPGLQLRTIDIGPQNPRTPEPGARRDEPSVDATPVAAGRWAAGRMEHPRRETAAAEKKTIRSFLCPGTPRLPPTSVQPGGPRGGFGGSPCFRRRWLGAGWMAAGITYKSRMVGSWEVGWRWRGSGVGKAG